MVMIADVAAMIENDDDAGALSRPRQTSLLFTRSTTTTEQQIQTELECEPYLNLTTAVDHSKTDHLEYFISRGLIYKTNDANDDEDESNEYSVRLLRDAHAEYLYTVFRDEPHKLRPSFVSLDSSHTWMIYWCLHGLDLMGKFQQTAEDHDHSQTKNNSQTRNNQTLLTQRIIRTIQSCYTTMETVSIARDVAQSDPILSHLMPSPPPPPQLDGDGTTKEDVTFHSIAGGFGGGPRQLPHAATTYAAIMSLCILAASSSSSSCVTLHDNHDDHGGDNENNLALEYLISIRTSLYVFFATLYNPANGSFRMHVDGEMDVRATYCVYSVLRLLRMVPNKSDNKLAKSSLFTNPRIADYIWSCQSTWEGGFGGEPGAEAHGGYTYCAVAALYLFREGGGRPFTSPITTKTTTTSRHITGNREAVRLERCRTWLRQRQMCYEGGFSGRINKLVDGCYSFWQGAASVILQQQQKECTTDITADTISSNGVDGSDQTFFDPWIASKLPGSTSSPSHDNGSEEKSPTIPPLHCDPFNALMLERYILFCTQDENGGLRDKPSKGRDFYHSCYCLSGLSIAQHNGGNDKSCHREDTRIHRTHPCYNIRVEYVALCQSYFGRFSFDTTPRQMNWCTFKTQNKSAGTLLTRNIYVSLQRHV